MINVRRRALIKAFVLLDPGLLGICYLAAAVRIWHLTEFGFFAAFISMRVTLLNILLFLGLLYSWHVIFSVFGLYRSRRLDDRKQEAVDVLKATSAAAVVLGLAAAIFRVRMVTPAFLGVFWLLASSITLSCRFALREFLRWVRIHGRNSRQILIVGTNRRAVEFAHAIERRPELGYQLAGFADEEWTGNRDFGKNDRLVVTDLNHFVDFLREHVVDEVIIALPLKSFYSKAARIVDQCQEQGIIVRALSNIFDIRENRMNSTDLDVAHAAIYSAGLFEGWPMVCKRLLDILVSLVLLIVLAPVFLVVALLVKLDSGGPIFFVQERVGLNKRRFRMYKFRTMVSDAEKRQSEVECLNEAEGPVFKIKNDPRVTRVGRFLRKASIDELPQFLNVLKGDMSLVGPRPLPIRDYQAFAQDSVRRRFSVRPGITCLWQVNGRSSISFHEWMELDLQYIDHWSFWLDVKVIAKTIPAVLKGAGAV